MPSLTKGVSQSEAICHTRQPCPRCQGRLDKIRYEKRVRLRTGVTYRMVCPACGWSDGPDLARVNSRRTVSAVSASFYLQFFTPVLGPGEAEEMARRAGARAYITQVGAATSSP